MRTTKEIALDLNKDYRIDSQPYSIPAQDGVEISSQEVVFSNLHSTELSVADMTFNGDVVGYRYTFFDTDISYVIGEGVSYSEQELEDIINGFTG